MTSRRRRATREAIMDSALLLFTVHGYDPVRVEDVAREAGVSRATFYNHFSEREEVVRALFQRLLAAEVPDHTRTNLPPLEQIEHVTIEAARGMLDQPQLARFLYSLPMRQEALLKPEDEATPAVFRTIHQLLETALDRGELRTDVPVDLMCVHVHNALEAAMRAWAGGLTDEPVERVRALVRLSLYGVVAGGAGP
ncbi:TetR/AcrR family transcriptional regulator [Intrasporangium sp.]|uniref:TetR/AcrR family transcriptional regulator n=1 Tax=Intrasporangium sp. TaxID=1925024 RepID=UPI0033658AE5